MATEFKGPYQDIYQAGLRRLRRGEARQRGQLTQAAGRAGVATSGVSLIPQEAVSSEELERELALGADVAGKQEEERLGERRFEQQKELLSLEAQFREAAERRAAKRQRRGQMYSLAAAGLGGLTGGVGGSLADKYF